MKNKKVVLLGGGRALSVLLRGLKEFPIDITAIVAVSDDGSSAGRLKKEFNIPAVGDLRGVLVALSKKGSLFEDLLQYRFETTSDLNGHTIGNLLLTALTQIKGSLSAAIENLGEILNIEGRILPFTEDVVTLVATMSDGSVIEGESSITEAGKKIKDIRYKEEPTLNDKVIEEVELADLIIFGIGSLYTSIIPNILSDKMRNAIRNSKAKKMYICNAMTQSGETDGFMVSDCIKVLNKYMKGEFLDVVIASNTKIPLYVIKKYKDLEMKSTVLLDEMLIDEKKIKDMNIELVVDDLVVITSEGFVEHNSLKTAFTIFSYLMRN